MGDAVNTTAPLSGLAGAGEILVPTEVAAKAHVPFDDVEHRTLVLKGKTGQIKVAVLTA
jgi:class 3 adenylate cyclase